jgi:4-hydroxybenzoate polyprenyltransferase
MRMPDIGSLGTLSMHLDLHHSRLDLHSLPVSPALSHLRAAAEANSKRVAGGDYHKLNPVAFMSVCASAGIFLTTIQAQDFKDTEGDKLIGRRTLPIVAPTIARPTLLLALMTWSIGLTFFWQTNAAASMAINALALIVGGRYVAFNSIREDQVSFYLYNVWLSMAHLMPAFSRLSAL